MSLEAKSNELKQFVSIYESSWFLGHLSELIKNIASGRAEEELKGLSSPLRQIYYLAGLNLTTAPDTGINKHLEEQDWERMVAMLIEIEYEYAKLFFPKEDETVDDNWKRVRSVAIPSFLSYFNQGPLNFEEQAINWVRDLYQPLSDIILAETGLTVDDFIGFYENIDSLVQKNFQAYMTKDGGGPENWQRYARVEVGVDEDAPDFIKEMGEANRPLYTFLADSGISQRFAPEDLVSDNLPLDKVTRIINYLYVSRHEADFLYYTATRPGNPLYETPLVDIGGGLYQVFEVKQVIHAIDLFFERVCSGTVERSTRLIEKKGKLLEARIVNLFTTFFKKDYQIFRSYYVDGCEQDILILWNKYAFIIEAKGYKLNEPFRDPNRAFVRIKSDFKSSIGYGFDQVRRIQQKFVSKDPLVICDNTGKKIAEIDTSKYDGNDFGIVVNLKSFGQIQVDLSTLLELSEDDVYPWVVRLDDLEVFLLTLIARKNGPKAFIDFLELREELHGKLICADELEVCGGYLNKKIDFKTIEKHDRIVTAPDLADIFDEQYVKGMGFENEKYLAEKKGGKHHFW